MNFDKINFPDFVVTNLYKDTLVILNNEYTQQKKEKQPLLSSAKNEVENEIVYLGQNKKNIAIIVDEANVVHIHEENLAFLSNILAACKLNIADVAIINCNNKTIHFKILKEQLNSNAIILFNLDTQVIGLPFSIPNYQVQKYNEASFLMVNDFSTMLGSTQEAKLEKSKLWLSLKNMFNL